MRYLLDTHAFIFWMLDTPELPSRVRSVIEEQRNQVAFSVLSLRGTDALGIEALSIRVVTATMRKAR